MPSSGVVSWTVVGPDGRAVEVVDGFLGWLTGIERSPNTVEAYARDLGVFWSFLDARGLVWGRVSVVELGDFAGCARRPAENVLVLSEQAAKRSASTVNRMLAAVVSFYVYQGRHGMSWRGIWSSARAAAGARSRRCCTGSLATGRGVGRCGCVARPALQRGMGDNTPSHCCWSSAAASRLGRRACAGPCSVRQSTLRYAGDRVGCGRPQVEMPDVCCDPHRAPERAGKPLLPASGVARSGIPAGASIRNLYAFDTDLYGSVTRADLGSET